MTPILPFQAKCKGVLVAVPEDCIAYDKDFYDKESLQRALIVYTKDPNGFFKPGLPVPMYPIPPGNWHIEGFTDEVGDDVIKRIIPGPMYFDELEVWNDYTNVMDMGWDTVQESFTSLLKSLGATNQRYLLLTEKI